jgi:hypothetical protein
MATTPGNALNITAPGIVVFNGVATFTADTVTQFNTIVGGASNTLVSVSPGTTGQVLTSNGAAANPTYQTITFTQMPWTDEATSFAAVVGNGYFVTATSTATLPASPSQGNTIAFEVDSAAGILTIQANTGQIIRIGKAVSASAGVAVSNFQGDSVTLVYRASDTSWQAISTIGTFSVT